MRDVAERALDEAVVAGASYADCRVVVRTVQTVEVKNGRVARVALHEDEGVGVRVIVDGAWGFAGLDRIDARGAEDAVRRAVRIARAGARLRSAPVRLAPLTPATGEDRHPGGRRPLLGLARAQDRGAARRRRGDGPGARGHGARQLARVRPRAAALRQQRGGAAGADDRRVRRGHGRHRDQRRRGADPQPYLALTRFARNTVHQNVAETGLSLRLRVVADGRVGVAELRGGGADAIERLVRNAEEARRLAPAQDDLAPLPQPDGGDGPCGWSEATAAATPEQRAEGVATVIAAAAARGLEAFGSYSTRATQRAVVNSRGVRRHGRVTAASLSAVVRGGDGAGYADRHAVDAGDLDPAAVAAEVIETAERNQGARPADPGEYEVVLAPYAVQELVAYLSHVGFSALAVQEHRSFMRRDERLMSPEVGIRDDAADPMVRPFPFDHEGVSTRRVTCIESGVCRDVVYDTPTAIHDGVASTGHGLPQPNTIGPWATHLVMDPGRTPVPELVAGVRRGLYVTRLWYVRVVHPLRTVITGMTREGTFLIEDGRLGAAVKDLRFTQSIVEALSRVRGISDERRLELGEDGSAVLVPWVRLQGFRFTS